MKYRTVVCGGTFDLLHVGHKSFITKVLDKSDKVIIGLTSDKYTNKFKEQTSENYKTRKENLEKFLVFLGVSSRVGITSIDDIYGPLLDKNLKADVLAVTPQTNRSAIGINKERKNLGLEPIEILVIGMDKAQDGDLISSTRIRKGEINREGRLYLKPEWKEKNLKLPEGLRPELQKAFGQILTDVPKGLTPNRVVTIGDVTTQNFNKRKIDQALSIVDFQVKRERKFDKLSELGFGERIKTSIVENPAGSISNEMFTQIKKAFKDNGKKIILVEGEEDLAVLPVILCAPLGFNVFYGQPDEGLVQVLITEEIKEKAYDLISKFDVE